MTIGIYKITNTVNGKVYIGKSHNIEERFKQHIEGLNGKEITILIFKAHGTNMENLILNLKLSIL